MSFRPIKLVDVELCRPLEDIEGLDDYRVLKALVRLDGTPVGYVQLPTAGGRVGAERLAEAILRLHGREVFRQLLSRRLKAPLHQAGLRPEDLWDARDVPELPRLPSVTVGVCTRDRPDQLEVCLRALADLDYPDLDVLIVDNALPTERSARLVAARHPGFRYVHEPRPGLDWARNRVVLEAKGEIVAFTDDDAVVDSGWVRAIARGFLESPDAMGLTGLVVPHELDTEAQEMFETYGGFGRGFRRRWVRVETGDPARWAQWGTGSLGTGANMAFRRSIFDEVGLFDPCLDVGTPTGGGGDLEMFFRMLKAGHTLLYEPAAIVRHRHRRRYEPLLRQLRGNGTGLFSYMTCAAHRHRDERLAFLKLALWWFVFWIGRRFVHSFLSANALPPEAAWTELKGGLVAPLLYVRARRQTARIRAAYGAQSPSCPGTRWEEERGTPPSPSRPPGRGFAEREPAGAANRQHQRAMAVRFVDLTRPIPRFDDVADYASVRLFAAYGGRLLGSVDVRSEYQALSPARTRDLLAETFGHEILDPGGRESREVVWRRFEESFWKQAGLRAPERSSSTVERLPPDVPVSIVVCTLDRPADLRRCLGHLFRLETDRPLEVIVVDNNPRSGLTSPVLEEFPGVLLLSEPRRGLAYARNAGFAACSGRIAVATDDDVVVPPDWLEKLVAPFVRPEVMAVTGNVLPHELDTVAQWSFERYGGLGRGFRRLEAGKDWYDSFRGRAVPTWTLGATANAAFRTEIFRRSDIGFMDEALGPGMPSGVGEDTYLFYRILKAGYTIVYEPSAFLWHRHRASMKALRRQLYDYSKGHVAYQLTTVLRDGDLRGLASILLHLPAWRTKRILWHLRDLARGDLFRGRGQYPVSLTAVEIAGNLAGPWALWRSRRRVRKEGGSWPSEQVPVLRTDRAEWRDAGPSSRESPRFAGAGITVDRTIATGPTGTPAAEGAP